MDGDTPTASGSRADPRIERNEETGISVAQNGEVTLTVLDRGQVFKRRAVKGVGSGAAQEITWLVAELDGVRIYIDGSSIVLTRQDLYP